MRVLVSTVSGIGHVFPVIPLVRSLRRRGHDVCWAVADDGIAIVEDAGVPAVAAGLALAERQETYFGRFPETRDLPPVEVPEYMFPRLFAAVAAPAMLPALLELADDWRPDTLIHDSAELAAPVVAGVLGVPHVTHGFGALTPPERVRVASELMRPLWRAQGLEPREWAGSYDHLYLDIYPPSMSPPYGDYIRRRQSLRPLVYSGRGPVTLPPGDQPLVYVTFGTVFNQPDGAFRAAVEAVAALEVRVLVTVGPAGDPDAFGALPANVAVVRYVPQDTVLPRCDLVVSHAGSGTFLAALSHGVPQLCLPRAADQFLNSEQGARSGAAIVLLPEHVSVNAIRFAAGSLLEESSYRDAAQRLRAEIDTMPHPDHVAGVIEELVG